MAVRRYNSIRVVAASAWVSRSRGWGIRVRLAAMMALLYGVQGAWWPLLALHASDLGLDPGQRSLLFATYPIAAIAVALGAASVVDRVVSSERYLAVCYIAGAGLLILLAAGPTPSPPLFGAAMLAYWLIVAPTSGIATSLALRNLDEGGKDFGLIRLWGTIGWMIAGWSVSLAMRWGGSSVAGRGAFEAFWVGGLLAAALGCYAMTLPHTPPLARGSRSTSLGAAITLAKVPGVGIYLIGAFGVALTTPFVFQVMPNYLESIGLPRVWASTAMTLGQVPEVAALAVLPRLLGRLGFKGTMLLGIGAYLLRFGSLAIDPPLWVAVAGIPLHGVGVACFTIGGQVFLDDRAPGDRRAGAQALNTLVSSGLGSLSGTILAGFLGAGRGSTPTAGAFLVPFLIQAGVATLFLVAFRPDRPEG